MKKTRRLLSCIGLSVVSFVLVLAMSGCGLIVSVLRDDSTFPEYTTGTPSTEADETTSSQGSYIRDIAVDFSECESAVKALTYINLSKYTFMVTVSDAVNDTLFSEDNPMVSSFYASRNALVKNRFLSSSYCRYIEEDSIAKELKKSIKAGGSMTSYFSDIVLLPASTAGTLAIAGYLLDLSKLPYYTVPDSGAEALCKIGNKDYFHISGTTKDIQGTSVLYFNKNLLGSENTKELYSAAINDSLSLETFLKVVKSVQMPAGGTVVSATSAASESFLAELCAVKSDFSFIDNSGTTPQLMTWETDTLESLKDLLSNVSGLVFDVDIDMPVDTDVSAEPADASADETQAEETVFEPWKTYKHDDRGYEIFAASKALFYVGAASDIYYKCATMNDEYGILPIPYSEGLSADSLNLAVANTPVICVPSNNSRYELTGVYLNALKTASGSWIEDGFTLKCIENYLRDNNSYYTLKKAISASVYCGLEYIYGNSVEGLSDATVGALFESFKDGSDITLSSSVRNSVNKALKKLK